MDELLDAFAEIWCEHAEVLNGGGTIDREYAVGSGRMDLLIRWPLPDGTTQREAIELKVWRNKKADPFDHEGKRIRVLRA